MKTKAELEARRAAIGKEIQAVFDGADAEKRTPNDDELASIKALEAEETGIKAEVAKLDEIEATRKRNDDRIAWGKKSRGNPVERGALDTPSTTALRTDEEGRVTAFFEATDEDVNFRVGDAPNATVRKSYRETKRDNVRLLKSSGYKPWGQFKSFASFVRAGFDGHQNSEFREQHRQHFAAVQGMSEGIGSDGGYTVMPEFANGIIDRVYANDLWSRTDNYQVSGNNMTFLANAETSRANGSRHGGMRGYWIGEGATITSSKPKLREVSMKLAKLGVVVYLTQELIDDGSAALQQYVARKAAEEFNFMIGDSLINGTGAGMPLGIGVSPSLISVAKESGQAAATLAPENVAKMFSRFYAPNLSNMVWLHNQDIGPELHLMTLGIGAAGQAVYMPPGGLSSAPYATLMGRPMQSTEFNATLGTQLDIVAADLSQMLSISKGGIAQAVSMHVEFLTDQLALRFVMRLNAGPWENAPLTPFKGTATQSSFVTLDTRA